MILKTLLLSLFLTSFAVLAEKTIPDLAPSESHLCLLEKGTVKCFGAKGEVPLPFSPTYPFGVYGGGNNQCVQDYYGVHCWNWEEGVVKDYPEFWGFTDIRISNGFVCAVKRGGVWSCLLAPKSSFSSPPLIPDFVEGGHKHFIVLDNWICLLQPENGENKIECFHPERAVTHPLVIRSESKVIEAVARRNSFALHSADESIMSTGLWKLPENPQQDQIQYSGITWRAYRWEHSTARRRDYFYLSAMFGKNLILVGEDRVFTIGTSLDSTMAGYLKLKTDLNESKQISKDIVELHPWNNLRDQPIFLNEHFVCRVETSLNKAESAFERGRMRCGEPGSGNQYFTISNSFTVSEKLNKSYWTYFVNSTYTDRDDGSVLTWYKSWKEFYMLRELLPTEKAAYALALISAPKHKDSQRQVLIRDLQQPIIETTNVEAFQEKAWKWGMELASLKQQIPVANPPDEETVSFLKFAKEKLGTEEEIKRDLWRAKVLEKIEKYLQ